MTRSEEIRIKQSELTALLKEQEECENTIALGKAASRRLKALTSGKDGLGEIGRARLAVRDAAFPIFASTDWFTKRIIDVNDKWITMRDDGSPTENVTRYNRFTGWKERHISNAGAINPMKAIEVWNKEMNSDGC